MNELFHYCSTEAFVSIVTTKSIRLSSLTQSNDSMEGRLVTETMQRLQQRVRPGAPMEKMRDSLLAIERFVDGLGFCLSEDGDLLSQWRGYAANATGVSIGFDRDYLQDIADANFAALAHVVYDPKEQERVLEQIYHRLCELGDTGQLKGVGPGVFQPTPEPRVRELRATIQTLALIATHLFELKSPAFKEEREWRLLDLLHAIKSDKCEYRSVGTRLVPFRTYPLPDAPVCIKSVILGPKHQTPLDVVRLMLERNGFKGVKVESSLASYR